MVVVGTGKIGTRFINKNYPVEEGLSAGTNKLPDEWALESEESHIPKKDKVGL